MHHILIIVSLVEGQLCSFHSPYSEAKVITTTLQKHAPFPTSCCEDSGNGNG